MAINSDIKKDRGLSSGIWFLIVLVPALVPTTFAGVHYMIAVAVFIFVWLAYRMDVFLLLAVLLFFAYTIMFVVVGADISGIRYGVIFLLFILLRHTHEDSLEKGLIVLVVLSTVWVEFELLFPTSSLRLVYRSSLQEFHIQRASGFFAFPGDLGHFAVSVFCYFVVRREKVVQGIKVNKNKAWYMIFLIVSCLFLLASSQSRLAYIQLVVVLLMIGLRQNTLYIASLVVALTCVVLFAFDFSYLLSTDWVGLYEAMLNVGPQSEYKRIADLALLFSGEARLYPAPLPIGVKFVESGFVSQFFRLGGMLSVIVFLFMLFTALVGFFKANRGSTYLACSIIVCSLLVTNFVGAPFERPKLMFYCAIFVALLLNKAYCIRRISCV